MAPTYWYFFSQNNWHDGGNSTEQYARAVASSPCAFVNVSPEEAPRHLGRPSVASYRQLRILPRREDVVRKALSDRVKGRKVAMFCRPDAENLRYLELARTLGIPTIYRCVDDWRAFSVAWNGYRRPIERQMIRLADLSVASSRKMARAFGVRYVPNACARVVARPSRRDSATVVGFVGLVNIPRFDLELVCYLAAHFPWARFELLGSYSPSTRTARNVTVYPWVHWRAAWNRMRRFSVGLIPYRGRGLMGMQPLKSWEYVGLGIPQVCRRELDLPRHPSIHTYTTADGAVRALATALRERSERQARETLAFAAANTWQRRLEQLLRWLDGRTRT